MKQRDDPEYIFYGEYVWYWHEKRIWEQRTVAARKLWFRFISSLFWGRLKCGALLVCVNEVRLSLDEARYPYFKIICILWIPFFIKFSGVIFNHFLNLGFAEHFKVRNEWIFWAAQKIEKRELKTQRLKIKDWMCLH